MGDKIQPKHRIHASHCAELSEKLEESAESFKQLGVRIPDSGRLQAGIRLLRKIGRDKEFPTAEAKLREIAYAISDGLELPRIAVALGKEQAREIVAQLSETMGGTQGRTGKRRTPYQYQSQFVVGASLAHSDAEVAIPRSDRSRSLPDFLVRTTVTRQPVEVKRPENDRSVERNLKTALSQLSGFPPPGLVVLDITDCLAEEALYSIVESAEEPAYREVAAEFFERSEALMRLIYDDRSRRWKPAAPARGVAVCVYARGWRIIRNGEVAFEFYQVAHGARFSRRAGSVVESRADALLEALLQGMTNAGLELDEVKRENPFKK